MALLLAEKFYQLLSARRTWGLQWRCSTTSSHFILSQSLLVQTGSASAHIEFTRTHGPPRNVTVVCSAGQKAEIPHSKMLLSLWTYHYSISYLESFPLQNFNSQIKKMWAQVLIRHKETRLPEIWLWLQSSGTVAATVPVVDWLFVSHHGSFHMINKNVIKHHSLAHFENHWLEINYKISHVWSR